VAFGALISLIFLLYWPVFMLLARQWWSDPDWSHGFLVPAFSGYVLWRERGKWRRAISEGSLAGLGGVALAILLLIAGRLGAELFTTRFSFVLLLASLVVYFGGWSLLRTARFPLAYLLLMIPWPGLIYAQVTLPLEFLASRWAAWGLGAAGIPVLREGNLLVLANYTLEVARACSGIRSLVSLLTIAVAYGYLADKRLWVRAVLVAAMVPIAVLSNAFRIFGTGVLTAEISPRLAHGFFHEFSGWLIFVTATLLLVALHGVLRKLAPVREANGV
jgi:exosortase